MFYQLPPVGNSVSLTSETSPVVDLVAPSSFFTQHVQFYNSGTSALAAAICAANKRKACSKPEVILPAYACPDLVSAAVFAGVKPVLVDLEIERPWFDLLQLADAITDNTVAIVAVNLFGIAERWGQLVKLAGAHGVVLIEDSAQYFPSSDETVDWQGELVVLSFGRGKPVSLLGGGAVISNNAKLFEQLPKHEIKPAGFTQRLLFNVKARLYNAMIEPRLYWLLQSLPFLHLGETRYHTLRDIGAMDQMRLDVLLGNISRYQDDTNASVRCENISLMLDSLASLPGKLRNLPRICDVKANRRLLRYPLLVEASSRDQMYQKLKQAGLGASIMYPVSLPKIAGVNHLLADQGSFPNAENFASRVLTLPTHTGVSQKDIDKIEAILRNLV